MDGRDTLPTSGVGYLEELQQKFTEYGVGKLASVSGRYFAMDRDLRWEKEAKAFRAMVTAQAEGGAYHDAVARVRVGGNLELERGISGEIETELRSLGYTINRPDMPWGGAQAVAIDWQRGTLAAGSDPRKDGCALGY